MWAQLKSIILIIMTLWGEKTIRESPSQIENQIMSRVYIRSITRSTLYQKVPFY